MYEVLYFVPGMVEIILFLHEDMLLVGFVLWILEQRDLISVIAEEFFWILYKIEGFLLVFEGRKNAWKFS